MRKLFRHSFRNRLLATMLAITLLPVALCSAMIAHTLRIRIDARSRMEAEEQSERFQSRLNEVDDLLMTAAKQLETGAVLQTALAQTDGHISGNSLLYQATEAGRGFAEFFLYDMAGICRYSTQDLTGGMELPLDWGVLHGARHQMGDAVYYASGSDGEGMTAAICLRGAQGEETGFLVMQIDRVGFRNLMEDMVRGSDLMIMNRFFRPIYSSQVSLGNTLAGQLRRAMLNGEKMERDGYRYSVSRNDATGLFLVLRQNDLFDARTQWIMYSVSISCAVLCAVGSILLCLLLSEQISLPLRRLQEGFDSLRKDDLQTRLPDMGQDELGRLTKQFNEMVAALQSNREEILRNQAELKEAQIRMLQAQLNPHFVCNTLDTMKWISKINNVPQVALMSTNLADILRFCISLEELVPLYREVEILERYVEIQRIRLSDDFQFSINIREELYDCMVPKMILQPIVENSIRHGLVGMEGSTITVSADYEGEDHFRITVTDNGRGLPPEMAGRPYNRDKSLAKGHLGLYNVDTILTRYYGEACGLYLDRGENGVGTSVTAMLPIQYEEEMEC